MRGSKYVQSLTDNIYAEVKKDLDSGKPVFYTGLPCQIAGLYGYLRKDYANLLTADIVCHGGSPTKIFQDSIGDLEKEIGEKIIGVKHRVKNKEWTKLIQCTVEYRTESQTILKDSADDAYLIGFYGGLYYRSSCYHCHFASMPRIGDITLGDFFGLGIVKPYANYCKNGISQVLINSEKGQIAFEKAKTLMRHKERPLKECLYFNQCLWRPTPPHPKSLDFFNDYPNMSFLEIRKKYLDLSVNHLKSKKIRRIIKKALGPHFTALGMLCVYHLSGRLKPVKAYLSNSSLEDNH